MIVAIISSIGMVLVGLLSFFGTYYSSKKTTDKVTVLVTYRLDQLEGKFDKLEGKVDKHNEVITRTFILEEQVKVANHRISDLESEKGKVS